MTGHGVDQVMGLSGLIACRFAQGPGEREGQRYEGRSRVIRSRAVGWDESSWVG